MAVADPITEAPQADQVPLPETVTETPPAVELDGGAAQAAEEAAAGEEVKAEGAEAAAEPEKPLTRAELESLLKEREESVRQEERIRERERLQRQRQSESRRVADLQKQEAEDRADLLDTLSGQLAKIGLQDVEPAQVQPILERYTAKREGHVTQRTLNDVREALAFSASEAAGVDFNGDLTPSQRNYAEALGPAMAWTFERGMEAGEQSPAAKAKLDKLVKAGVEAELAKRRPKEQLPNVPGRGTGGKSENELLLDPNTPIETLKEIRARQQRGA